MSCVVKWCKNRSDRKKKNQGITYHRFSKENVVWRNDWIQIIRNCNGDNDWIPNECSVICSIHFEDNDLYTTKGGLRRVITYAIPQKFLFESTHMAEELPAALSFNSQESASVTVPALKQPGSSTMVIKQEYVPAEPNTSNALRELSASVIMPSIEQPCFSTMVIKQEEQPAKPNISSDLQESISVIETKEFEQPDTTIFVFKEEQPAEPNISSAIIQENSSETGAAEEQVVLPIHSSLRSWYLKQSLIKKQDIINKQKRKIKTLNQKVKRLQERNKSLKDILKSFKDNNYGDTETFNRLKENVVTVNLFNNSIDEKTEKNIK